MMIYHEFLCYSLHQYLQMMLIYDIINIHSRGMEFLWKLLVLSDCRLKPKRKWAILLGCFMVLEQGLFCFSYFWFF